VTRVRITMSRNERGEVELWLNPAGRDLLVQQLQSLSANNEHFHLGPSGEVPGVPLETRPYQEGDQVFEWGKVLFRLDEWDTEHFPHVMEEGRAPPENWPDLGSAHEFEPGMDNFVVQFRRDGQDVLIVHTFAWDEEGALAHALKTVDQHPETDPREIGKSLEVRIGKVIHQTDFTADWRPLDT
jgi:hypothetical protein